MIRLATHSQDYYPITAALLGLWAKNPSNQMQFIDQQKAFSYMQNAIATGRVVIVDDTFAVMFDVGTTWYSSDNMLMEELVLRIVKNDVPVERAIEALDDLRRRYECVMIVAGDTQVGYMTPKYLACGYRVLGQQLIKD